MKQVSVQIVRKRKINKDLIEEIAVKDTPPNREAREKLGVVQKPLPKIGD
jgi:hypothetical protein